ncbi:MAG: transposase [Chromatiales bacterium]|nr:transposase [Chromatiales bacterium]
MSGWAFYQLRQFITYKAKLAGVYVVIVDPRHASRTCPVCGSVEKGRSSIAIGIPLRGLWAHRPMQT